MYIQRNLYSNKIVYSFDNSNKKVKGTTNYTMGILPIKISVTDGKVSFNVKQSRFAVINNLPILNITTFTRFFLYNYTEKCGSIRKRFLKSEFVFKINGSEYILKASSKNEFFVYDSEQQILNIKKRNIAFKEKNTYDIYCIKPQEDVLTMLFCIFIDVVYFSNRGSYSYIKYEVTG